jgi:hypothetical protein
MDIESERNIKSKIYEVETALNYADFVVGTSNLWVPEFGFSHDEREASELPYEQQYLAALWVFYHFFASVSSRAWVHLAASMQAGKTGVVTALIRLMMNGPNRKVINMFPTDIFVITGMNDDAWKKQTKVRLPRMFRDNVYHSKGLINAQRALHAKAARNGGVLRDVLIVQDESHIACGIKCQPSRMIYDTLVSLCPPTEWVSNNIRLLTISATDPSAIIGIGANTEMAAVVKLLTTEGYQSPNMLLDSGRLHDTYNLYNEESVIQMLEFVVKTYGKIPLYHIIRPKQGKSDAVAEILSRLCPEASVVQWDSKSKSKTKSDDASTTSSMDDINVCLLENVPETMTFIIIKNMFYAAKTLNDTHVGLMHDRIGHKDDTNLQSLIGRGCGYGKSTRTHIFGSLTTVHHQIDIWSKITPTNTVFEAKASSLRGKMPGVTVSGSGNTASMSVSLKRRVPMGPAYGGVAGDAAVAAPKSARVSHSEDDFDSYWSPWYDTEKEVMDKWKELGGRGALLKTNPDGFKICSTTEGPGVIKKEEIEGFRAGKKTANMDPSKLNKDGKQFRRYVAYSDVTKKYSAQYCLHMISRKK